ncbi:MAG: hypothetical protein DCF20_17670 [Pseudanabaena sp.]|nr:MAG: hypothetical protein DCF20_17670 [Pseudanabaena sp.]
MECKRRHFIQKVSTLGISTFLATVFGHKNSEAETLQATIQKCDRRIQVLRTAPIKLLLLDRTSIPITNQIVQVEHIRHLFNFGAAYHADLSPKNTQNDNESKSELLHREYFLQLFNAATVTFYWRYYEPQENQYADAALLKKIDWLQQHRFYLRGHPLFWNHNPACLPTWLENRDITSQKVRSLMDKVLKHMSKMIFPHLDEVDVFNELVNWNNYDHPFTDLFKEQGKIAIVKEYLTKFKKLNPNTLAVINDFVSNNSYAEMLQEFQNHQVPFDAIGQQAHMFGGYWSIERLTSIIKRLSVLGKPIVFTEVSSLSGAIKPDLDFSRTYTDWQSDPINELKQADYLESFYRIAYSYSHITGIFLWTFSDLGAWLGAPTGILHKDGTPKPAFIRLNRLINETWRTEVQLKTNNNGYAIVDSAYEGEYKITTADRAFKFKHTSSNPINTHIRLE